MLILGTRGGPGASACLLIFNEIDVDWSKPVTLCEGVFDMFKCGENAIPMLGSSLNEESRLFNMIIAHSTPVLLALDSDMRHTKVPKIAKKLGEYSVDVSIVDLQGNSDPGSMSRVDVKRCIQDAKPFQWVDLFASKLQRATRTSLVL